MTTATATKPLTVKQSIAAALKADAEVTVTRKADEKTFTGKLVLVEIEGATEKTYAIRTGRRGRPVSVPVSNISNVEILAA